MLTNSKPFNYSLYPEFIKNNVILNTIDNRKVFPEIGLKNCKHSFSVWNQEGMYEASISYLKDLKTIIEESCNTYAVLHSIGYIDHLANTVTFLKRISSLISKNPESFLSEEGVGLVIPENIGMYVKGTDLFTVISANLPVTLDDYLPLFRNICKEYYNSFTALNKYNLKIVFSGSGDKCVWDLSTMSMRGIDSCQKWLSVHASALVGSMVDPCAGIIYIESPDVVEPYGSKMIKRSVVRFVLNKRTNKPAILIERVYPHDYDSRIPDYVTITAFENFIDKKTKGKYPILYGEIRSESENYFIPKSEILKSFDDNMLSYRDSKILYREVSESSLKNKNASKILFNKV